MPAQKKTDPTPEPTAPPPDDEPSSESLIRFLLVAQRAIPYRSEDEEKEGMDLLRQVADDMGVPDVVPPPTGPTNAPLAAPDVPPPGPVAEPVPPDEQPPPPVGTEAAVEDPVSPEATNAFTE